MHIKRISIDNFKGIRRANLEDLKSLVLIAGENGSGKSCVFDAIRLLKSIYGGYQPNETQQWFGEFQIDLARGADSLMVLFNDKNRPLRLELEIDIDDTEREF